MSEEYQLPEQVGLLGALCDKEVFDTYGDFFDPEQMSQVGQIIHETLAMLHQSETEVTADRLFENAISHPRAKKKRETLRRVCQKVVEADASDVDAVVLGWQKQLQVSEMTEAIEQWSENPKGELADYLQPIQEKFAQSNPVDRFEGWRKPWRIGEVLAEVEALGGGLDWPWPEMNRDCGKLYPGQVLNITGYVNSGKSSFCTEVANSWLGQLPDDSGIIFFNNEDTFKEVLGRFYTTLIARKTEKSLALPMLTEDEKKTAWTEKAWEDHVRDPDRLWIVDEHDLDTEFMRAACKDYVRSGKKLGAVVIQDLDHCQVKGHLSNYKAGSYGPLYAWARGLAKEFNTRLIIVSQMKASEEFNPFPSLSQATAWSKGDKQASVDMLLTIGKVDDSFVRFIGCPKSKSAPDIRNTPDANAGLNLPLLLDRWTGRFTEFEPHERDMYLQQAKSAKENNNNNEGEIPY